MTILLAILGMVAILGVSCLALVYAARLVVPYKGRLVIGREGAEGRLNVETDLGRFVFDGAAASLAVTPRKGSTETVAFGDIRGLRYAYHNQKTPLSWVTGQRESPMVPRWFDATTEGYSLSLALRDGRELPLFLIKQDQFRPLVLLPFLNGDSGPSQAVDRQSRAALEHLLAALREIGLELRLV